MRIFQIGFRLSIDIGLRTFTSDFEGYRLTVTVINGYDFKFLQRLQWQVAYCSTRLNGLCGYDTVL